MKTYIKLAVAVGISALTLSALAGSIGTVTLNGQKGFTFRDTLVKGSHWTDSIPKGVDPSDPSITNFGTAVNTGGTAFSETQASAYGVSCGSNGAETAFCEWTGVTSQPSANIPNLFRANDGQAPNPITVKFTNNMNPLPGGKYACSNQGEAQVYLGGTPAKMTASKYSAGSGESCAPSSSVNVTCSYGYGTATCSVSQ